ncbi:hypothetical protein UFOVP972_10 [uncultured Caudovirales phage]|uniref:Uncharacterized protein n=1 Tax=uncultured Caudovirales phage TaxID=2100421 RepID=A0A6J5PPZ3_9CAUD|nr:hypothetical protein UFOVP972_10 [uncultured Caudovirales phage]
MILDYISPVKVYRKLKVNLEELSKYRIFKKIIIELNETGRLAEIGLKVDYGSNMYIGLDLNPELLLYSETSKESVELRLISEKMNKYNDFLTKEGILDSIKVDYERVQSDDFYGYILQIGYDFKKYKRSDLIYSISYFSTILFGIVSSILLIL